MTPSSSELVTAAYKTVDTFNGIVKRRIWLKNGKTAKTDGNEIVVPFSDPDFYLLVERQLAHILFRSDAKARQRFVQAFLAKTSQATQNNRLNETTMETVQTVMERVIDVLESRRIESLWGMIYPGSHQRSRDRLQMETTKFLPRAHDTFFDLFVCLDAELDVPPGSLDRFRPYFVEALQRVERRGFTATLVLARWLIVQLVNELLREDRGLPPPSASDDADGYRVVPDKKPAASGKSDPKQKVDTKTDPAPDSTQKPGPAQKKAADPVQAGARERVMAFQSLAHQFGTMDPRIEARYNDYSLSTRTNEDFFSVSKSAAKTALDLDMRDEVKVERVLTESGTHMTDFLDSIQKQLVRSVDHDDWLKKDTYCKLVFIDVRPDDPQFERVTKVPNPEDVGTVQRLRSVFFRVMGRRKLQLDEAGTDIDTPSIIERRITGQSLPCFKSPVSGRGFRALILVDRSHSMKRGRIQQAERAAEIISDALDFPFVDLRVWGFQSLDDGEVTITRFDPRLSEFHTEKAPVDGFTPLHIALRVAIRDLSAGSEEKQLIVLTDGAPLYAGLNHRVIAEKQLRLFVREEVHTARRRGINVTALLIGDTRAGKLRFDVSQKDLAFMFGSERYWKCVDEHKFGSDLIKAVSNSFVSYLSAN
jgi:hypothetical protein